MTLPGANPPEAPPSAGTRWWCEPLPALLAQLQARAEGLDAAQAGLRLRQFGPNAIRRQREWPLVLRFLARLANPLILVLLLASLISALMGDKASFGFVAVIVVLSVTLDFVQEHRAGQAAQALQNSVALKARLLRAGAPLELPAAQIVPGDVLLLAAGNLIPADARVLEANDFFVNQAQLTGEAYPVEKRAVTAPAESTEAVAADSAVFMGSSVVAGSARVLVCETGDATALGRIAHALVAEAPPTAFERGIRRFSLLLTRMTIALVLFVLLVNTLYHRPLLDSFLFAVALAVGLTPELLPMIVSVTLARGARRMAAHSVIVKRLSAIEDLGAMDVLCTDKTGTLTEAKIRLERHLDAQGQDSAHVFELAYLNSAFETGLKSPLDEAILAHQVLDTAAWHKLDEVPFDFERRRVSVLVERDGRRLLIVKGAPEDILRVCVGCETAGGGTGPLTAADRADITRRFDAFGAEGLRVLALATRRVDDADTDMTAADEHDLVFAGFVAFLDPPKLSAGQALRDLQARGIAPKIVTGDNEAVTRHLCTVLRFAVRGLLTGPAIAQMDDWALRAAVQRSNVFCRVTPEQKNRIVLALQARGHVVGYLGDGINDAPPLHSADVGISVDGAVDVATQAADLVLMEHDLDVLRQGVLEGRRTFVNVMKYIMMATSSNFGNMASMAAAALFVPFLPMLPVQILLNNFLYDLSEIPIPLDQVDSAELRRPKPWNIALVRNFMLCFGPLSSLFDFITFAVLIFVLKATEATFQTAWFIESMATQVLVVFVIRTRGVPWRSHPSPWLTTSTLAVAAVALMLPFTPLGAAFGFVPVPWWFIATVVALTASYLVAAEALKHVFHRLTFVNARRAAPPSIGKRRNLGVRRAAQLLQPQTDDHHGTDHDCPPGRNNGTRSTGHQPAANGRRSRPPAQDGPAHRQ
ncbi:magnesium-translocating P-type ATPase [Piscinibacter sp.]|jgi:Mg2+-importing ATPase|uniref:magnesium-translocating P-type ATPase n=1 Tax=Piscinibacter sp. TaxID=1903157 RepID=UPI00355A5C57